MPPLRLFRGVSPPSAPQLIVTGPSITQFALYYYTRSKVRLQNKAAAATDPLKRRGSLLLFLARLLPRLRI